MTARATIRVRPDNVGSSDRPSDDRLQRAADLLAKLGFEILRVGRFGISVEGNSETFASVLGVRPGRAPVQQANPKSDKLAQLVDIVEVAAEPEYF